MNKKTIKYLIVITLTLIILICSTILMLNYKEMFTNKVNITYPNGCVESYINGKLVTEKCNEIQYEFELGDSLWINKSKI